MTKHIDNGLEYIVPGPLGDIVLDKGDPLNEELITDLKRSVKERSADHSHPSNFRNRHLAAVAVAVAGIIAIGGAYKATTGENMPEKTTTVEMTGEFSTIWSLADAITDDGTDVRETVYEIRQLNPDIDPAAINSSTEVVVPSNDLSTALSKKQHIDAELPEDSRIHIN